MRFSRLKAAAHKMSHYKGREYVGWFQPTEILALVKAGCECANGSNLAIYSATIQKAQEMKEKGDSQSLQFYFVPPADAIWYYNNKKKDAIDIMIQMADIS